MLTCALNKEHMLRTKKDQLCIGKYNFLTFKNLNIRLLIRIIAVPMKLEARLS